MRADGGSVGHPKIRLAADIGFVERHVHLAVEGNALIQESVARGWKVAQCHRTGAGSVGSEYLPCLIGGIRAEDEVRTHQAEQ